MKKLEQLTKAFIKKYRRRYRKVWEPMNVWEINPSHINFGDCFRWGIFGEDVGWRKALLHFFHETN